MAIDNQGILDHQRSVIAVLRPASHPRISPIGTLVELDRSAVTNNSQENLEKFLQATLNSYIENSDLGSDYFVRSSFYVDPTESSGYPVFTVLRLEGLDISDKKIEHFRSYISLLCADILEQPSLFNEHKFEESLSHNDQKFFQTAVQSFLQKNGGQRIKKEFYVHLGLGDHEGVVIKDFYKIIENSPTINELEEGLARPDGLTLSGNEIYLLKIDGSMVATQKNRYRCIHQNHYAVISKAIQEGLIVRFRAERLRVATSKKDVASLISLDIIPSTDEEFTLT